MPAEEHFNHSDHENEQEAPSGSQLKHKMKKEIEMQANKNMQKIVDGNSEKLGAVYDVKEFVDLHGIGK